MRHRLYLALFICLLTLSCDDSIPPDTSGKFIKFYGGAHNEIAYAVEELPQGGFVIVGSTEIRGDRNNKDVLIIRTDASGNRVTRSAVTYDGEGSLNDEGRSVLIDANGNILILGYTTNKSNNRDFLLLTMNGTDENLQSNSFGDTLHSNEEGSFLINSSNGGYLLIGNTDSSKQSSAYLVKIDNDLRKQYTRIYGLFEKTDSASNILESNDGNIVWCGSVEKGSTTAARIVESDGSGNLIADTYFYKDSTNIIVKNMQPVSGGYVIAGSFSPVVTSDSVKPGILIINTDGLQGDTWEVAKTDSKESQYGNAIYPTTDGHYIITGKTISEGNSDILLLKCTRQGEVLWQKTFGGAGSDEGTFVKQTADGGYIILATVTAQNNTVIALIKTDAKGNSISSLAK